MSAFLFRRFGIESNSFERLLQNDQITSDDGIVTNGLNSDYQLEYTHLYAPRKLRQSTYLKKSVGDKEVFVPDLLLENDIEIFMKDKNGRTALHYAAMNGFEEVSQLLIDKNNELIIFIHHFPIHLQENKNLALHLRPNTKHVKLQKQKSTCL